jgi:glycine/D-amino acid oxidase-like deaminating enzyme
VNIETNTNVTSVEYDRAAKSFSGVQLQSSSGTSRRVPCRTLVLAAGPWSDRVYNTLFPDARIKLPMNSTERAGNHIRIKIPGWKDGDTEESVQVYYTNVTPKGSRFDVTSFTNGDLYIGGWGAIAEEIPALASSIRAQPSEVKDMIEFVKKYVTVDTSNELEYFDAGRCYRPTAIPKRPIITKVDWDLLGHESHADTQSSTDLDEPHFTIGGLVINTAHGSDGITLGPGSGQLASELVLGRTLSVDISSLGIPETSNL